MSLLPKHTGYGLELELAAAVSDSEYLFTKNGQTPQQLIQQAMPTKDIGEEECAHIVELKTDPLSTIQFGFKAIQNQIKTIQGETGITLAAHPEPIFPINSADPNVLTQRGRELIEQDGEQWLSRLEDTAVCSLQVTSSQVLAKLAETFNFLEKDVDLKRQFISLFLHTIRLMSEDREKIDNINNRISGKTSGRLDKVESLLNDAKSSMFHEDPEFRYNFQAETVEEYLAFLVEVAFLSENDESTIQAKKAHHLYAKLKFDFNPSIEASSLLKYLKRMSYQERVDHLQSSQNCVQTLLDNMDFIGVEYRPFDATLDETNVSYIASYIYNLEARAVFETFSAFQTSSSVAQSQIAEVV